MRRASGQDPAGRARGHGGALPLNPPLRLKLRALLWDVDGTLAETERDGHRIAFNQAFERLGVPWRWDEAHYGELLKVTGGRERLLHDMRGRPQAPPEASQREALAARLHAVKNECYARIVADGALPLRPGVRELMNDCARAGVRSGIVTTTSRVNVDALLAPQLGARWESLFGVIATAQEAPRKKPDPQAYHFALQRLDLAPHSVLAIEDSPAGVAAARAAEVPVLVTRSYYFANAPITGAVAVGACLADRAGWQPPAANTGAATDRIDLEQIERWHAQAMAAP